MSYSFNLSFPSKDQLERAKLTLDVLVYFSVIIFIVVAIIAPQRITQALSGAFAQSGARLEEVDLLFMKFKLTDTLSDAQSTIIELRKLVVCEKSSNCTSDQVKTINTYVSEGDNRGSVATALGDAIQKVEKLRDVIPQQVTPSGQADAVSKSGDWVVIFSASQSLEGAQHELKAVQKDFPTTTRILLGGGWYRSVVAFGVESDAKAAVSKIRDITHQQPYVRNFNTWCPNAVSKGDYTQCGALGQ
jgi:hypothetical protein